MGTSGREKCFLFFIHVKNFYADVGLASRPCQKEKKKNCVDRQDRVQKFFKVNKETMFFLFDSRNPHCYQTNSSIGIHSLSSQYNVAINPKRIGKCSTLLLTVVNQPAPVFKIRIELLDYWGGETVKLFIFRSTRMRRRNECKN